jgi:hypothetical protein
LKGEFMLRLEHAGEQIILAPEVMIERALRQQRVGRDLVHADATEALSAEEAISGF